MKFPMCSLLLLFAFNAFGPTDLGKQDASKLASVYQTNKFKESKKARTKFEMKLLLPKKKIMLL